MVDRKPNEGALFSFKAKPDTPPEKLKYAPNYSGELLIDLASALIEEDAQGNKLARIRVAGWKNVSKSGTTYLKLVVSKPMEQRTNSYANNQGGQGNDFD